MLEILTQIAGEMMQAIAREEEREGGTDERENLNWMHKYRRRVMKPAGGTNTNS